jgi:hypothetical protein
MVGSLHKYAPHTYVLADALEFVDEPGGRKAKPHRKLKFKSTIFSLFGIGHGGSFCLIHSES